MKYSPYSTYGAAEINWLGCVPQHWGTARVKNLLQSKKGAIKTGPFGSQLKSADMAGDFAKVFNQRTVLDNDFDVIDAVNEEKFEELKSFQAFPDDLLITTRGTIGRCALVPKNAPLGILHPCVMRLQVDREKMSVEFLRSLIEDSEIALMQLRVASNATTIDVIYSETLKDVVLPVPPPEEQTVIANFLDRETGRIDALIAKQRELIELLGEKRRALISRCVTRGLPPAAAEAAGLDPHPQLKPTGVDWLGDVPEHWDVKPLKHVNEMIRDGTHLPPPRCDQGIPLLSVRNIVGGEFINLSDDSNISESDFHELNRSFVMKANDVLLAIVGATLGKVAIVPNGMKPFHIQRSLCVLRPNSTELCFRLLAYWLRSKGFQDLLWTSVGFSAQPGIYLSSLKDFPVVVPPLKEQTAIANFLDAETAKLDRLVSKAEEMIDRLQEYRTALITAAVTGKIDVRGEVHDEETRNENDSATSTGEA